jgi:hypothetical protein
LAAVCADGTALPPGIIFESKNCTLRNIWVADIETGKHSVHVTSTPSGWTNNETRLGWLEQVFDCYTKQKAMLERSWRLLIIDGHGSHLTQDWFDYCKAHRIILAQFPPHSLIRFNRLMWLCSNHSQMPIPQLLLNSPTKAKACYQSRKATFSCYFGPPGARSSPKKTSSASPSRPQECGQRIAM